MHENSLARTVSDRVRSVPRAPQRPGTTTPDGTNPPALALIVAPALLAVCFR